MSMVLRAASWRAILGAAVPEARPRLRDAYQGTAIGVLVSATLPARLGEVSRALVVARRLGPPRRLLPTVVGTLVTQTVLNLLALVILGVVVFRTTALLAGHQGVLLAYALAPLIMVAATLLAPALLRFDAPQRSSALRTALRAVRATVTRLRAGLTVFRSPRLGVAATAAQLGAWGLQLLACYVLLAAMGLDGHGRGLAAAAAVLFAVNVTAVLPVTPSNVGVFQAACVAVLTGGYGFGATDALGYGIVLQAVELATALALGGPALLKEGLTWREVRLRALHATPFSLAPYRRPGSQADG
jgi:phosphatidyl-myo-inositol alpha-mannosyltransferase